MALSKITEAIREEARLEAKRIKEEADRQAGKIAERGRRDISSYRTEEIRKARTRADDLKRKELAKVRTAISMDILSLKRRLIEEAFQKALLTLMRLPNKDYQNLLQNMFLNSSVKGDETVIISPEDKDRISDEFLNKINEELKKRGKKGELKFGPPDDRIKGGFILRGKGVQINNSFNIIISNLKEPLESSVANILFE
jgi:V/A-type H+-transporting ATPase subunit E